MPVAVVIVMGLAPVAALLANLTIYGVAGTKRRAGILLRQSFLAAVLVAAFAWTYLNVGDVAALTITFGALLVWAWLRRAMLAGRGTDPALLAAALDPRRRRLLYLQAAGWIATVLALSIITDGWTL